MGESREIAKARATDVAAALYAECRTAPRQAGFCLQGVAEDSPLLTRTYGATPTIFALDRY